MRRGLAMPYILTNFIDIKKMVKAEYGLMTNKIEDIMEELEICTNK